VADDLQHELGYGKPPKAFQFQKGRSGNPSGRPRKNPGIPEMLARIERQKVLVHGKNGPKYITKEEASLTQVMNKAAGGDLKAIDLYVIKMICFHELAQPENMQATARSARAKLSELLERLSDDTHGDGIDSQDQMVAEGGKPASKEASVSQSGAPGGMSMPIQQRQGLNELDPGSTGPPPQGFILNAPEFEITDE
jgi:hypothetical protein